MIRIKGMILALLMLALLVSGVLAQEPDWSYEGETGPENWASLNSDYELCASGTAQSPIDIEFAAIQEGDFPALVFDYQNSTAEVVNTGNGIDLVIEEGGTLEVDSTVYTLNHVTYHLPSEHTVEGEQAAMEMQLIHESENGNIAVVSLFLVESDETNEGLSSIWEIMPEAKPADADEPVTIEANMGNFVDPVEGFLTYTGSLTTPPCTEDVIWLLWNGTLHISADQLAAFAALHENNVRPTQPLNDRPIFLRGS